MSQKDMIRMFAPYVSERAIAKVCETLRSGYIGEGPVVKAFEQACSNQLGIPYPVAVNSCTSALHLALAIAGVRAGDEVITTAQTMMATSHAILMCQAKPVFADIQYETGNISPDAIRQRLTEKTKAIVVVHWAGYPCDLEEIQRIADSAGIPVVEDAAHAIGASYKGNPVGGISRFTCYSFQAIKHITTGDGGMLCLRSADDYEAARRRRWYGIDRAGRKATELGEPAWDVTEPGYKYHMNDIAASLGAAHLEELPALNARRARIAGRYREMLANVPGIQLLEAKNDRRSANWLFTLHAENRLALIRQLAAEGIQSSVVHQRIDSNSVFGGIVQDLPNQEKFDQTQLAIPLHQGLSDAEVDHIISAIRRGW